MANFVETEIENRDFGKIARVTVNNQRKLNTLNSTVISELDATFDQLGKQPDIAAVILTGAGEKAFVGGADIGEMATLNPETARTFITNMHHVCQKVRFLQVPVIARVNGYSLGAGMELAASCDMIVACKKAVFGMPEVRIGVPSVIDAALLPSIIGVNRARDLVLTGRTWTAQEAYEAGLVQRLCENDKLDSEVETVLEEILISGREAIKIQKQLCNDWENSPLATGIQLGIDAFSNAFTTNEPQTMMQQFLNRER
ncbi:MAG: enoyl-CoA hydratase [Proteobacteria bacterium]|nr:enoyl-CoA hydratase [Pseudomonadota bacterium]